MSLAVVHRHFQQFPAIERIMDDYQAFYFRSTVTNTRLEMWLYIVDWEDVDVAHAFRPSGCISNRVDPSRQP